MAEDSWPITWRDVAPEKLRERLSRFRGNPRTGCAEWLGARTSAGYGAVGIPSYVTGRATPCPMSTHRIVLILATGLPPVPNLQVDHICSNRICMRPGHLRWATGTENIRARYGGTFDACRNGHAWADSKGYERCIVCARIAARSPTQLLAAAQSALGVPYRTYVARHGKGCAGAIRILRAHGIDPCQVLRDADIPEAYWPRELRP